MFRYREHGIACHSLQHHTAIAQTEEMPCCLEEHMSFTSIAVEESALLQVKVNAKLSSRATTILLAPVQPIEMRDGSATISGGRQVHNSAKTDKNDQEHTLGIALPPLP